VLQYAAGGVVDMGIVPVFRYKGYLLKSSLLLRTSVVSTEEPQPHVPSVFQKPPYS
jgi:hypothetical protein